MVLGDNLPTTNGRPIEGSKDADFCLFIYRNKKLSLGVWAQGTATGLKKPKPTPLLWRHPQKAEIKNFPIYLSRLQDFRIFRGLNSSLVQSDGKLWLAQIPVANGLGQWFLNFTNTQNPCVALQALSNPIFAQYNKK